MRVFVSVDMEGIGGVTDRSQLIPGERLYEIARGYMLAEARTVVERCWAAGATSVAVNDAHDGALNLSWDQLEAAPRPTRLIHGPRRPLLMNEGVQEADVAIFVGYHAMAGTPRAVMDHTYSEWVYRVRLNGREIGETGINAAVAGAFGVPVVLVCGDAALAAEAEGFIPTVETAITKEALARRAVRELPPATVHHRLAEATDRALARVLAGTAPLPMAGEEPATVDVEYLTTDAADCGERMPGSRRLDGRTVSVTQPTTLDAFRAFCVLLALGHAVPIY